MKKEQIILSIDGATKTGWAIYKDGKITKHGTKRLSSDEAKRLTDCGKWLQETIEKERITTIVAEDIYRDHNNYRDTAFMILSELRGILIYISKLNKIEISFLNPLRVKAEMIPSRTVYTREKSKQRMINRVNKLGYRLEKPDADDEADAIGILITYLKTHNLELLLPQ